MIGKTNRAPYLFLLTELFSVSLYEPVRTRISQQDEKTEIDVRKIRVSLFVSSSSFSLKPFLFFPLRSMMRK